jgi:hypothetical protein
MHACINANMPAYIYIYIYVYILIAEKIAWGSLFSLNGKQTVRP